MDYACPPAARHRASGAILRFPATRAGDHDGKSLDDVSFIRELISNTINRKNILRLASFEFNLAADIFDMRVNGAFIGFKRYAMDGIQ
jgi:hypothetical protein